MAIKINITPEADIIAVSESGEIIARVIFESGKHGWVVPGGDVIKSRRVAEIICRNMARICAAVN